MQILCDVMTSTTFLTVLSGTLLFIIGQTIVESIIKPIQMIKRLRIDSIICLRFYANIYHNCLQDEEATKVAREIATRLIAYHHEIPRWILCCYGYKKEKLLKCSEQFILLSNRTSLVNNKSDGFYQVIECEKKIVNLLNIKGFPK